MSSFAGEVRAHGVFAVFMMQHLLVGFCIGGSGSRCSSYFRCCGSLCFGSVDVCVCVSE